jgi:hypothetical protein
MQNTRSKNKAPEASLKVIRQLPMRTPVKGISFMVGQRVKLSSIGRDSLKQMPQFATTGVIAKPAKSYPDAISVIRDGAKTPLQYHKSYWVPMN